MCAPFDACRADEARAPRLRMVCCLRRAREQRQPRRSADGALMWALPCACSYALFACARIVHVFCPSRCSDSDLHAVGVRINIECANDPRHGNNTEHATNGCNGCNGRNGRNGRNGWNANKSTNVSKCAQSDAVLAARPFHPSKNASLAPRVPISTVSKPSEPMLPRSPGRRRSRPRGWTARGRRRRPRPRARRGRTSVAVASRN